MLSSLICSVGGAGDRVGGGDCWDNGAEHVSQDQSPFFRYWVAFKIPEHFACTYQEHLVHLLLTPRLVTLRVHTGQGCFVVGSGFGCTSPDMCRSFWWVPLSSLLLRNHVADQFSRFELTRGRKHVEMNSRLSGLELISICWHLLLPDSSTSCRLKSLEIVVRAWFI